MTFHAVLGAGRLTQVYRKIERGIRTAAVRLYKYDPILTGNEIVDLQLQIEKTQSTTAAEDVV